MTRYAVDEARGELLASWSVGYGEVARTVGAPAEAKAAGLLGVAAELSRLSEVLWRCYTHPASAAASMAINTEGWRRQDTRDNFPKVVDAIRKPNLPDENGSLRVSYDPVMEYAHRVGRCLHAIGDLLFTETIVREVEAEIQAVEQAELGDLSDRAAQAVTLTRADVSPVQVAAADEILARSPLGGNDLFLKLDPAAASVAAAHWLYAAATVVSQISRVAVTNVVVEADNIEALPHATPTAVLELLEDGISPTEAVTMLIREAMAVAEGYATDFKALGQKVRQAKDVFKRSGAKGTPDEDELRRVELTTLDPQRPARDMLEDLLTGIRGCWLLYSTYADRPSLDTDETDHDHDDMWDEIDDEINAAFDQDVRTEANANRHRLGLQPAPLGDEETEGEVEGIDFLLEADDIGEQLVEAILATGQPDIPRDIIASLVELKDDNAGRLIALLIARGTGYLAAMREAGLPENDVEAAVNWVGVNFGVEYAGPAAAVAGLAGHAESHEVIAKQLGVKEVNFAQLADFLGMDFFPAMMWLCTGLTAITGDGESEWLSRYR